MPYTLDQIASQASKPISQVMSESRSSSSSIPLSQMTVAEATSAGKLKEYNELVNSYKSPTVMTSANISEKTIPDIQNKLNSYKGPETQKTDTTDTSNSKYDSLAPYLDVLKGAGMTGTDQASIDAATAADARKAQYDSLKSDAMAANDKETASLIESIQQQEAQKEADLIETQKSQKAQYQGLLYQTGGNHSDLENSIMSAKNSYDLKNLTDLQNLEKAAIAKANAAHDAKDYEISQKYLENIDKIRQEKVAVAKQINENLMKQAETRNQAKMDAARDNLISEYLTSGITDSKDILKKFNEAADNLGINKLTSEQLKKTMDAISGGDTAGLTGNIKSFYAMQSLGQLPEGVTTLQQFLNYIKPTSKAGVSSPKFTTSTIDTHNKFASDNAKIPYSVVGMTQQDFIHSLNSETSPKWFSDTITIRSGQVPTAEQIQSAWDEYKKGMYATSTVTTKSSSGYKRQGI